MFPITRAASPHTPDASQPHVFVDLVAPRDRILVIFSALVDCNRCALAAFRFKASSGHMAKMKDNTLFRVGNWDQGDGDLWNKIEQEDENGKGGYWFSDTQRPYLHGLAVFYDRTDDIVRIKQYYHCSCDGTDYEDGGPGEYKFVGRPSDLRKIVLRNADYAMPQRACDPRDSWYKQGQLLYHVFAVWLSEGKPEWEGKGRAYHVEHGAHEPRHFRDEDRYFGADLPLPE